MLHIIFISSSSLPFQSRMVDLGGYVIILVETNDKRVKLYGSPADKADLEVNFVLILMQQIKSFVVALLARQALR